MINRGTYAFAAAPAKIYSRRAVGLVASSLVIDMLAPLKITMSPDYVAHRLTDAEAAEFRASGITGFHNAYGLGGPDRSEEHTSELQSLMRISDAVFCLKKKKT